MAGRIPVADKVYEVLLRQLMAGSRAPGDSLNISVLSHEFEVSQTPLREALARLEHSGLVHREALRGYFVADRLTPDEIVKLSEVRLLVEPAIARNAALRRTPEFIADVQRSANDLLSVADGADSSTDAFRMYWVADHTFHSLLATQSGNSFLRLVYDVLGGQIQRFRLFSKFGNTSARHAGEEHQRIIDALELGDADLAEQAMIDHVNAARDRILATIS